MARSAPIARQRRSASCALAGPMLTAVSSLLPIVSRSLIAAEIVLSSPGSRTSEITIRSEEHTSELQSHSDLVCRLLLEKKKKKTKLILNYKKKKKKNK